MSYKTNGICCFVNVYFTFLFLIYSILLYAGKFYVEMALSQAISALPVNEIEEALFLGAEMENNTSRKNVEKRGSSNTAWFGPRLGRRKRAIATDDEMIEALESKFEIKNRNIADEAATLTEFVKNYPQFFFYLLSDANKQSEYLTKRQIMKPRLGRGNNAWSDDDEKMIKAPPFSPRLGRRALIPLKPRLGRAGNNPETAVFKPRLGRDPSFNEFNEYMAAAAAAAGATADSRNNIDGV